MTDAFDAYRPPQARVEDDPRTPADRPLAGRGRRFAGLLLDVVGVIVFGMIVGFFIGVLQAFGIGSFLRDGTQGGFGERLLGWALGFAYYLFFEGLWARTPGKMVLGMRVVGEDGGRPSFLRILGRTAARFIPLEGFTFLAGVPGLHDRASKTRVVTVR